MNSFLNFFVTTKDLVLLIINELISIDIEPPVKIGEYVLLKKYEPESRSKNYAFGIYKDAKGKKYFAKIWSGRFRDFEYKMLKNELTSLSVLNRVYKRMSRNLPQNFKDIKLANVVYTKSKKHSLIVIFDYIEIKNKTSIVKVPSASLIQSSDLISYLGENMTPKEKKSLQRRSFIFIFFAYFLSILKLIFTNPKHSYLVFKNIPLFLKGARHILSTDQLSLSHRDLNNTNIIVVGSKVFLVDFALCLFAVKYYDKLSMLVYHWDSISHRKEIYRDLSIQIKHNPGLKPLFIALLVYIATYFLTNSKILPDQRKRCINILLNSPSLFSKTYKI